MDKQNDNENQNQLFNRQEAASYIGVKKGTLEVWASTKRYKIPFIKVGRLVRYRKGDLDEFLKQRTVV